MRHVMIFFIFTLFFVPYAMADNGLVSVKSSHGVEETAARLERVLQEKGMTVFIRIDHAAGAKKAGEELLPTQVVIFGNPKVGTALMKCRQSVGIDLPLKALIAEDETGQVWFSYNTPQFLDERHGLGKCAEVLKKVDAALGNFAKAATMP